MKVIDTHFDLTFDLVRRGHSHGHELLRKEYISDFKKGDVDCVVSAIYIDDAFLGEKAYARTLDHIQSLEKEVEKNSGLMICRDSRELKKINDESGIGFFISLEGIEPIEDKIERIDEFFDRGVRLMGLTWSRENLAASGSRFDDDSVEDRGLTDFGFKALKKIEEKKIVLDVSHLNEQGFWDVINNYGKPIIASHSNCRAIRDITRNLSDEQIRAIGETGGYIGVNSSSMILSDNDDDVNEKKYVDHIDHIVRVAGIDHVGFGFDFCNRIMGYMSEEMLSTFDRVPFDCIGGHQETNRIISELRNRDYTQLEIEKITSRNFMRIVENVLD